MASRQPIRANHRPPARASRRIDLRLEALAQKLDRPQTAKSALAELAMLAGASETARRAMRVRTLLIGWEPAHRSRIATAVAGGRVARAAPSASERVRPPSL